MNDPRSHAASILGLACTGLLAAAVAVAVFHREPATRRQSWCPPPEPRASAAEAPATAPAQVVHRLREIRARFRALHPDEAGPDDAPGPAAELDRLIRDLTSDLDLADTPLMESSTP